MDRAGARRLAEPASEKAESVEELSEESKAALLDWMRRAASCVPAQLPGQRDDQFQVDFAEAPLDKPGATFWFLIQTGDADPTVVEARIDSQSVLSLQAMRTIPGAPKASPAELAASKLGMLMDVELVVTVRFGGRRMLLKDILDLCAGSVVELDQQVQEPVDLLLDGKLIARGEVVVVDGNYGLRITEVLSSAGN
jgi:flagellar motor switch protein FliN/FliY